MIDIDLILALQKKCITDWHTEVILTQNELPWKYIEENNHYNFLLWHEEDIARIKDIDPLRMVNAKRNIDKFNQLRNNAIEKIDEWMLTFLAVNNDSKLAMHSETPGMMMDRLSIMALKRYHMFEETTRLDASIEHKSKCSYKVMVLDEQISDLANCLRQVLQQLYMGELKLKVYRQFKMYNDPELNPQLYKRVQA
jgi:hypothetical protein